MKKKTRKIKNANEEENHLNQNQLEQHVKCFKHIMRQPGMGKASEWQDACHVVLKLTLIVFSQLHHLRSLLPYPSYGLILLLVQG